MVVISSLMLGVLGLAFFRQVYVSELSAMRLARAAVLAHAMSGCRTNEPHSWLGRDRGRFEVLGSGQDPEVVSSSAQAASGTSDANAQRFLARLGSRAEGAGRRLAHPITRAALAGRVHVSSESEGVHRVLSQSIVARSYGSCADPIAEDARIELLSSLKGEFSTFVAGAH